ncbi:MAG TPA: hypothetical protein VFU81_23570 [Thermomicrobiales bacterium]|nr:hypothetical protein [Thermomicrobiales bacterium]
MLADRSPRGVIALLALCLALVFVAPLGSASAPIGTPSPEATPVSPTSALLDLPWLTLAPSDVPDPGYLHLNGGFEPFAAYSRLLARDEANSAAHTLAIAQWRQTYQTWLRLPSEEDPDVSARVIHVTMTQYRDGAGASAGFAARQIALDRLGFEASATRPTIGDEAVILRGALTETTSKRTYVSLFALARFGELTVEVDVRDYTNDAPPTSLATALLTAIADRLPAVRAGETPGFSLRLPRVPLWRVDRDRYLRRGGDQIRAVGQTLNSFRANEAFARDNAVSDWYVYDATRVNAAPSNEAPIGYSVALFQFPDAAAAEAYLGHAPADWKRQLGARAAEVVPLEAPAAAGPDALLFTFPSLRTGAPPAIGYQAWLRDDDVVARMSLSGVPTRADAAAQMALTRLAGCVHFACTDLADLDRALAAPAVAPVPPPAGALATPAGSPAATPMASAPSLVDLGWVALGPEDMGQAEYGLASGTTLTAKAYAALLGGDTAARTRLAQALTQLGWRQAYQNTVATPSQNDPDYFDRAVSTVSIQFADAQAAGQAMTLLGQSLDDRGWDRSAMTETVGDQSILARRQIIGPSTGRPGELARLLVQDGPFVLELTISDYTNDAPAASELIRSMSLLQGRLRAARAGETPNLSLMTQRLAFDNPDDRADTYTRRDGAQVALYRQSATSLSAADARYRSQGIRDLYNYRATWSEQGDPNAASLAYGAIVARFATADDAAAFVEGAPWRLAGSTGVSEVKTVATAPQLGDSSVTVSYVMDIPGQGATPVYSTAIRVGDRVAAIDLFGAGISVEAFERLAQGQAACLQSGDCWDGVAAPPKRAAAPAEATPLPGAPANVA